MAQFKNTNSYFTNKFIAEPTYKSTEAGRRYSYGAPSQRPWEIFYNPVTGKWEKKYKDTTGLLFTLPTGNDWNIKDFKSGKYYKMLLSQLKGSARQYFTLPAPPSFMTTDLRTPEQIAEEEGKGEQQREAEKKFIETEFKILSGSLDLTPTKHSIRLRAGHGIRLKGLGFYLSGYYFVEEADYEFSVRDGISNSYQVSKLGFGDYLKNMENIDSAAREPAQSTPSGFWNIGMGIHIKKGARFVDGGKVPYFPKGKFSISRITPNNDAIIAYPYRTSGIDAAKFTDRYIPVKYLKRM